MSKTGDDMLITWDEPYADLPISQYDVYLFREPPHLTLRDPISYQFDLAPDPYGTGMTPRTSLQFPPNLLQQSPYFYMPGDTIWIEVVAISQVNERKLYSYFADSCILQTVVPGMIQQPSKPVVR